MGGVVYIRAETAAHRCCSPSMLFASMLRHGLNVAGALKEFRGSAVANKVVTDGCRRSGRELSTDPASSVQESRGLGDHLSRLCIGRVKGEGHHAAVRRLLVLNPLKGKSACVE